MIFIPQPLSLWGIVITRGRRSGGFYPSAIKAVGYSDHQRRAGSRAGSQNSALTKKIDEFCLFFTDMTYVPGQFISYIFLAPSHKRPFSKKAA